jgi:hypothetical protein
MEGQDDYQLLYEGRRSQPAAPPEEEEVSTFREGGGNGEWKRGRALPVEKSRGAIGAVSIGIAQQGAVWGAT